MGTPVVCVVAISVSATTTATLTAMAARTASQKRTTTYWTTTKRWSHRPDALLQWLLGATGQGRAGQRTAVLVLPTDSSPVCAPALLGYGTRNLLAASRSYYVTGATSSMTTALRQRDEMQLALPGTVSRTGMELHPGLSKQDWLEVGRTCALVERANRWWIGDLLNYGEREYGETYSEAQDLFELEYSTLAQLKWVASEFQLYERSQLLTWSHHLVLAPLESEMRSYWMQRAEDNNWSVRELKAHIKGTKPKPLPTHKPLLRFCQDLPTPIIVAQILRVFFPNANTAFDLTGGDGGFWDGSELLEVTRLTVDPSKPPDEQSDFRSLPYVPDDAYDVTLFDPPHVADAGDESIMGAKFGTYDDNDIEQAIQDGCREAWRIGRLGTVIKVTDHVHGQRYVLESDWVREAIGRAPFDEVYQVRANAVIDPKWTEQLSAYNNGATYLIFRKDGPLHKRRNS